MSLSPIFRLVLDVFIAIALACVPFVVLGSCRSTVTSPEGPAVDPVDVVMSDHVREHVGVDEPERVDLAKGADEGGQPSSPPSSPVSDLAPRSTNLASGGLLCCSATVCVVPGPADCHHRVLWCDHYTLSLDATAGIYVAHCENERTTPP